MLGVNADLFLNLVVLFFNTSSTSNLTRYEPEALETSAVFFTSNETSIAIGEDDLLANSAAFPKCCPPGMIYVTGNRACANSSNTNEIYKELNITADFVQSGLKECLVIVDRYVNKSALVRRDGDGSLVADNVAYPNRKFCVDGIANDLDHYVVRLCQEDDYCDGYFGSDAKSWCVSKCCPDGYNLVEYHCSLTYNMGIKIMDRLDDHAIYGDFALSNKLGMDCLLLNFEQLEWLDFEFEVNRSAFIRSESKKYKTNEYCLDTLYDNNTGFGIDYFAYCTSTVSDGIDVLRRWKIVILVTSSACYILTMGIYLFVYRLRKFMERIIFCCCFACATYTVLRVLLWFNDSLGDFCVYVGYLIVFAEAKQYAWRNVLCFEIWRKICYARAWGPQYNSSTCKWMTYYIIYTVTLPGLFLSHVVLSTEGIYRFSDTVLPKVDRNFCMVFISDDSYGYLQLTLPRAISIGVNVVLYVKTIQYFLKTRRDVMKILDSDITSTYWRSYRKNGFFIVKLGFVMGLAWIHFLLSNTIFMQRDMFKDVEFVTENIVNLEGVFFFLIFGVKWNFVKRKACKLKVQMKDVVLPNIQQLFQICRNPLMKNS